MTSGVGRRRGLASAGVLAVAVLGAPLLLALPALASLPDPVPASGGAFTAIQPPFTESTYGASSSFLGGIAFAPNGDVWADECRADGSPLHRFSTAATYTQNGSVLHQESVVPSGAGCGLTNGPGGKLYSNTSNGVVTLDASTGAVLATGGPGGNALGIAADPADGTLVYPGAACAFTGSCPIDRYDPATGQSSVVVTLAGDQATFVDGVTFDPSGRYLLLATRGPATALTIVDVSSGTVVQQVPMSAEPDGIALHWTDPQFVVTNNTDGSMTSFDFPNGDLASVPQQSTFASGGFRGDLSLVRGDGCAFASQDGTRFADGTVSAQNSIVALCPGFTPSPGVAAWPKAQVLFLHGLNASYSDGGAFAELRNQLANTFGAHYVRSFEYYQDLGDKQGTSCDPTLPGEQTPPTPDPASGIPYDSSQNGLICDSEGDLGQNAARLDAEIQRLYHTNGNRPVILIGYSMGAATIRSFLSYSTHVGDGVATSMVDSVVLMHGVEQGSWLGYAAAFPFTRSLLNNLAKLAGLNLNRPAPQQFAPSGAYMHWVDSYSDRLPNIPMYNTWGNEVLVLQHCILPFICLISGIQHWGDMVILPGTDDPTQTPPAGGERFLPGGRSVTRWEWAENDLAVWNPQFDPLMIVAVARLIASPVQHTNYQHDQAQLTVADCQTGQPVVESTELFRVVAARMNGQTYACRP